MAVFACCWSGGIGAGLREIRWDMSALPVFEKNFYHEHPAITARSEDEVERWRKEHSIMIQGAFAVLHSHELTRRCPWSQCVYLYIWIFVCVCMCVCGCARSRCPQAGDDF